MILLVREQHGRCSFLFVWRAVLLPAFTIVFTVFTSNSLALEVDTQSREASRQFYLQNFQTNEIDMDWSGDHLGCDAGATSGDYRDTIEHQINFFRAMAGVPAEITLDDEFNAKAQEAALVMSKNIRISHTPPTSWSCYTDDAAEGAGSSNLLLGTHGPNAISRYMFDPGEENYFVGHRRWILHPQTERMGTGDVPRDGLLPAANSLWVFDENVWNPRPETRDPFIAWPPAGFVPSPVVYPRWSFGFPDADFSSAEVTATLGDRELPLHVEPVLDGFSDPTIVWELDDRLGGFMPMEDDLAVTISISDVRVGGVNRDFEYDVTIFDPNVATIVDPEIDFVLDLPDAPECQGSDFNEDGVLSFDDFLLLARSFGSAEPQDGDTNCDGSVNFDDFLLFVDDFQAANRDDVSQAVPESSSTRFLLCVCFGIIGHMRRSQSRPRD